MDELTKAILAAAAELTGDGWSVDDDGCGEVPGPDSTFFRVISKHVAPLTAATSFKEIRLAALRAEIAAIEST